nr:kelch-like protein 12 [Parasteatoda tepidariorum]
MDNFKISHSFQKLADITLKTEDGYTFESYKILLAQASKYFATLFCGDFNQSAHTLVPTVKGKVLHKILCYVTRDEDILTEENLSGVLFTADYLMMEELVNSCKVFTFNGGLTVDNCIQVYNTSWITELTDVRSKCRRFIQIYTEEIFTKSKTVIIDLPLDALQWILECDNLNMPDENIVWDIVISWIKGNTSDRIAYLPELLKYIRIREIDKKFADEIKLLPNNLGLHCTNLSVSQMIEGASDHSLSFTGFQSPRMPSKIYLIFKHVQQREVKLYTTYDERFDYWSLLCNFSQPFNTICKIVCVARQFVYFAYYDYYHPAKLKAFDVLQETWTHVSRVPQGLFSYSIVSVNDDIYALGGEKTSQWNDLVDEVIDSQNETDDNFDEGSFDDWNESLEEIPVEDVVESSDTEAEDIEVDLDEQLNNSYEEDFNDPVNIVDTVFRYNHETDSWHRVSSMNRVHIINEVVLDNKIFVIGTDLDFEKQVCQVYDTVTDSWTIIANPKFYRAYCEVSKFCGKLYLIGGKDKCHYKIQKVEEYNPTENLWRTLPDLPFAHDHPKAVIIRNKLIVYDDVSIWNKVQLKKYRDPILWDNENELWCDAKFITKDLLTELKLCQIRSIDNVNTLRELSKKQKCERSVWAKSNLANLDSEELITCG